ncbi:MAG: HD domain-containing protein [Bacteroidota bacterium]|jgi:putative nucleotidyltransferase with HDIG domain|nr:HD domain-containing protein [Bacteroidota bacterium]
MTRPGNIATLIEHPDLRAIGRVADDEGCSAFVVGGVVRDRLMGRETTDIDIAVSGDGVAFARRVQAALHSSNVVAFERFGTARIQLHDREIEFVGMRRESYTTQSRKPRVETGTIADDLARRDFTVNAMAVSILPGDFGALIDPYDGFADLERTLLRTPLDADATFSDDPLRMMRAFRFAAQLDFRIDATALDAITRMRDRIAIVSAERIRDEFLKMLATPRPSRGLAPMQEAGLMAFVFPEFHQLAGVDQRSIEYPDGVRNFHHKDVFYHTLKVLDNLCAVSDDLWLRFAAILHDIAKPKTKRFVPGTGWTFHGHPELGARMVKPIFQRFKLPLEPLPFVKKMVILHLRPIALINEEVTDAAIRRLLFDAGEDIDELLQLCRADITSKNPKLVKRYLRNYDVLVERMRAVEERDRLRNWQPPVDGETIMRVCGLQPGIAVGILKTRIEDAVLEGLIPNDHDAALAYLLTIKDEVLAGPLKKKPRSKKSELSGLPAGIRPEP